MLTMLMALLVVLLPPLQTTAAQAASPMPPDVDRLVRAAEKLTGTWPSQPPPAIPEVAIVARHGKAVAPRLVTLLSDDPNAERDRKRWKVQQQVALTLSRIYSESPHCGRTYCDGDPPERIARVRAGWLRLIASDKELQGLSVRALLDRFKRETMFWRQYEIGKMLAAANDRAAIAELEAWLRHDDRHVRALWPSFWHGWMIHADFDLLQRFLRTARCVPLVRGIRAGTGGCRGRFVLIATSPRIFLET